MSKLENLTDMKLVADIKAGESASRLLTNPDYIDCMTILEADLINKWRRTKDGEGVKREELYKDAKALKRIREYLEGLVNSAKMAQNTRPTE